MSATESNVTVARTRKAATTVTPERIAEWKAALEDGMGYKHVSEAFEVSITVVRKYLPGMGWSHQQVIEHASLVKQHKALIRKANYV